MTAMLYLYSKRRWRWRIGDYRVIARTEDERVTILVVRVAHLREVTGEAISIFSVALPISGKRLKPALPNRLAIPPISFATSDDRHPIRRLLLNNLIENIADRQASKDDAAWRPVARRSLVGPNAGISPVNQQAYPSPNRSIVWDWCGQQRVSLFPYLSAPLCSLLKKLPCKRHQRPEQQNEQRDQAYVVPMTYLHR